MSGTIISLSSSIIIITTIIIILYHITTTDTIEDAYFDERDRFISDHTNEIDDMFEQRRNKEQWYKETKQANEEKYQLEVENLITKGNDVLTIMLVVVMMMMMLMIILIIMMMMLIMMMMIIVMMMMMMMIILIIMMIMMIIVMMIIMMMMIMMMIRVMVSLIVIASDYHPSLPIMVSSLPLGADDYNKLKIDLEMNIQVPCDL